PTLIQPDQLQHEHSFREQPGWSTLLPDPRSARRTDSNLRRDHRVPGADDTERPAPNRLHVQRRSVLHQRPPRAEVGHAVEPLPSVYPDDSQIADRNGHFQRRPEFYAGD